MIRDRFRIAGGTLAAVLVLVAARGLVAPSATVARSTLLSPATSWAVAASTPAARGPYALDLFRSGDFVAQTNLVQCVGASIQMMTNLVGATSDRSAATQRRLFLMARASSDQVAGLNRKGASVRGWSRTLNAIGLGPYAVVGYATLQDAMHAAAVAIRVTHRPVGLLMWHGRHAWVMSGFEATADPRATDAFEVTRAVVLDPLYPRGSRTWGASPKPGARLTMSALGRQFVPRGQGWTGDLSGQYVLVVPQLPAPVHVRQMTAV